jgi:predicted nucleic acid-binding Zn ribbon protein
MVNEFKCVNDKCNEHNKVKEITHRMGETPSCTECNTEMKKIYSFSGGIKTGDGYKS